MSRLFRTTSRLLQATPVTSSPIARTRLTTGLTGLAVHPSPLPALLQTYASTLSLASQMPPSAVYRQAVESITKERIAAIEELGHQGAEKDIEAVEARIGMGLVEELIVMAEGELQLAAKMLEWKA